MTTKNRARPFLPLAAPRGDSLTVNGEMATFPMRDQMHRRENDLRFFEVRCQMAATDVLKEKREHILQAAARHGARNVRLFGSVARGDADERSDIDLLVEMEPGRTLLDRAALWLELEELLACKVDVVSDRGIKPRIRDRVLREAKPL